MADLPSLYEALSSSLQQCCSSDFSGKGLAVPSRKQKMCVGRTVGQGCHSAQDHKGFRFWKLCRPEQLGNFRMVSSTLKCFSVLVGSLRLGSALD
ncbi:hypothetical protein I79_009085 [Cricetulus griseus]|uniref:Uncharacterized protein n=1 Tax=Cricetulus griseus TaxID=10029 RepID=G3HET9_CRIGR|nr:hypothetical protein I79_009085 [Cricetulus griseus]